MSTRSSRQNVQHPTPDSPPLTPSTSSTNLARGSQPVILLNTPNPVTTPASTPPPGSSSLIPRPPSGMGINFPPDRNPLPAELSGDPTKMSAERIEMAKSASDSGGVGSQHMASTWSTGFAPPGPGFGSHVQSTLSPARAQSPAPLNQSSGFASSSSFHGAGINSDHRERVVSPTRRQMDTGSNEQLPLLHTDPSGIPASLLDQNSSLWSPAMDGKKEPSIKPPPYDPNLYANPSAKSRSRSPFTGSSPTFAVPNEKREYQGHPLSSQAYNHPTTRESSGATGGFYDSAAYWLCLYFCFNLGLTLFNKIVLVSFPFPYTLTGLHALSGCAGTYVALERGAFVPARLTTRENIILAAFSVLYTINIAVSNISLQLVTVPFHQVVRASTPLFTILISTVVLRTRFSMMKLVSLLPVVAGVGFATYGDYYFTAWGLILTLLGTFLAALKTVITNLIQTGGGQRLKLHPLDLLMRMSPLAFIQCVVYGWYTGELERVRRYGATQMTQTKAIALLVNGVIACGLNIVSFTANKKAGALTMTVSANCKQVLTIALAVVMFDLHISPTNGIGILLTLIGGGWYGYVEYMEKQKKSTKLVDRS